MYELQGNKVAPLSVFISYAHEDELLLQQLEAHLSLLRRQGLIADWHDRKILPGTRWAEEIDAHLEAASLILLLISPDFLASDYCYDIEMQRALERDKQGKARVIPVILRPCDWKTAPFAYLHCLPHDGKPVTMWKDQDEALLAIARDIRHTCEALSGIPRPAPRFSALDRRNRMLLLKRVRAIWIEGVLEHSLHQAALLALDLQERPDALANPWRLEVQETNLPPKPLPTGTSITQVYQEADGALLILGEPGAGKSTLLLELARALLERAAQNEHLPIPVVFNLSSWAQKRIGLAEWLVEELWLKYQVPRSVGKAWAEGDRILPLLDGLDEVETASRPMCVQAINSYSQQHLGSPVVVCCRTAEYYAQATRVWMNKAAEVQPLTAQQIEHYLSSAQGKLEGVRHLLQQDTRLRELVTTPLMLSILTLTYHDVSPEPLDPEAALETLRDAIFAAYVRRMFIRRGAPRVGTNEQITHWLTMLAVGMQQQQTELYLEHLQPSWLTEDRTRRWYRLCLRLVRGLVYGLGMGLFSGLVAGLGIGLFNGLLLGLLVGFMIPFNEDNDQIRLAEILTWSWKVDRPFLVSGLLFGLGLGLLGWLLGWLHVGLIPGLFIGLGFGLSGWLLAGPLILFFGVISWNQLTKRTSLTPNEGIWRSAKNGLLIGLGFGLVVGLATGLGIGSLVWLIRGLVAGLGFGLVAGLGMGLFFGSLAGLLGGLNAFLAHFILRFWLWRANFLPWGLIAFLDEAAERLLLRKVGGGYIFIHRLLLDHFASLEKKES